jgi:hypothetical protein
MTSTTMWLALAVFGVFGIGLVYVFTKRHTDGPAPTEHVISDPDEARRARPPAPGGTISPPD